jgi:hypothetical protein
VERSHGRNIISRSCVDEFRFCCTDCTSGYIRYYDEPAVERPGGKHDILLASQGEEHNGNQRVVIQLLILDGGNSRSLVARRPVPVESDGINRLPVGELPRDVNPDSRTGAGRRSKHGLENFQG